MKKICALLVGLIMCTALVSCGGAYSNNWRGKIQQGLSELEHPTGVNLSTVASLSESEGNYHVDINIPADVSESDFQAACISIIDMVDDLKEQNSENGKFFLTMILLDENDNETWEYTHPTGMIVRSFTDGFDGGNNFDMNFDVEPQEILEYMESQENALNYDQSALIENAEYVISLINQKQAMSIEYMENFDDFSDTEEAARALNELVDVLGKNISIDYIETNTGTMEQVGDVYTVKIYGVYENGDIVWEIVFDSEMKVATIYSEIA